MNDEDLRQGWYVVMTRPRGEFHARGEIEELGRQAWAPYRRRQVTIGRRKVVRSEPTFSRYIFARIDQADIAMVNQLRWVTTVLRCGEVALPVPAALMDALFELADGDLLDLDVAPPPPAHNFKPFDWITFIEGPMQGVIAQVKEADRDEIRVWLTMLGGEIEARVDPSICRSADPPETPRRERGFGNKKRKTKSLAE